MSKTTHKIFPEIIHVKIIPSETSKRNNTIPSALYVLEENLVVINVSPRSFNVEYEFFGFSGVVRDISERVIHELTHWATRDMNGHEEKIVMSNRWRTRNSFESGLWSLVVHSILYDLKKPHSEKTYYVGV